MDLILITGFLGAGKTTFLKALLPLYADRRIALIINEFGKVGVDGVLLGGLGAFLHEVTGGSVFCSCRLDQFEEALLKTLAETPDVILVEASGLSDPTAVRAVLSSFPDINYAGCVALCDAPRLKGTMATARVSMKQLAVSDLILLNKSDLVTGEQAEELKLFLKERFPRARIEQTVQAHFKPEWLDGLGAQADDAPFEDTRDITLQKAVVKIDESMTVSQCRSFLKLFVEDTYRTKGLVKLQDASMLIDCVSASVSMEPCDPLVCSNQLVVLAGKGMPLRKSLKAAQEWYPDLITVCFGE